MKASESILENNHPYPWSVKYYRRCEEWDEKSGPHVIDANGRIVVWPEQKVGHPGLPDPLNEALCYFIVQSYNQETENYKERMGHES